MIRGRPVSAMGRLVVCVALLVAASAVVVSAGPAAVVDDIRPWEQINTPGFGNPTNAYVGPSGWTEFQGKMYVGTSTYATTYGGPWPSAPFGGELWSYDGATWVNARPDGFGDDVWAVGPCVEFKGKLLAFTACQSGVDVWSFDGADWTPSDIPFPAYGVYAAAEFGGLLYAGTSTPSGGEIWSSADGATWSRVAQSLGGFGEGSTSVPILYNDGDFLYAGTQRLGPSGGIAQVWRSGDGMVWQKVVADGFGQPNMGIRGIERLGDHLYVSTVAPRTGGGGGDIWRSADGAAGTWSAVELQGFGDPNTYALVLLPADEGLYCFGVNDTVGGTLFHTSDGTTWSRLTEPGIDGNAAHSRAVAFDIAGQRYALSSDATYGVTVWREKRPTVSVSPAKVNFGDVEIGKPTTAIVTVTNTGSLSTTLEVALDPAAGISMVSPPATWPDIAPGASVDITLSFAPAATGTVFTNLHICTQDPASPEIVVPVAGNGVRTELPPEAEIRAILACFNEAVAGGELWSVGPGKSADGRRAALRNMVEAAGDLIASDRNGEAATQLWDAYAKCDGAALPPDFVAGPAASCLAEKLATLATRLEAAGP